jgi:indolepyruvate ferredoxin oxidoreductase beta subunit
MRFDILLTGVGGEGVLTAQVILARAANLEGYFVRGLQLHGLAQRGGSIPTTVRFGDEEEIFSPTMMPADANLILAFEPLEALRAISYGSKEKTVFVIDDEPLVPVYAHLLNKPYPSLDEIERKIAPFAKEINFISASKIARKKFGDAIFGNIILLGAAYHRGLIPLKKENIIEAIKMSAPRNLEENLKAFTEGINGS